MKRERKEGKKMNKIIRNHRKDRIIENHTYKIGDLTVVEITTKKGRHGVGWCRRVAGDKMNPELGESIARGRAEKALTLSAGKIRYCKYMCH
jgi:hypothetical protein